MFLASASSWSYKPHSDRLVSVPEARGRKVRPNLLSAVFYNVLGLDSGWRRFLSCHSCSQEQNSSNGGHKSFHVAPRLICECNELEDSVFRQRIKKKTPAEGHTAGVTQRIRRTASWDLVAHRRSACLDRWSVFRANLHGFHASLGFRSGLKCAVVDNGRRRRGRLLINDGAFFGRRVPHDVEFSGLSEGRRYRESDDSARKQELLHSFLRRCLFAWE